MVVLHVTAMMVIKKRPEPVLTSMNAPPGFIRVQNYTFVVILLVAISVIVPLDIRVMEISVLMLTNVAVTKWVTVLFAT